MTGEEAAQAVRPALQAQASKLSDILLGDFKKNNGVVDFYYRRGSDGRPYLFFVTPGDLRPDQSYGYTRPGFFASSDLAPGSKLSATTIPGVGDDVHEKLALDPGETVVYAEGDDGQVYRVRVVVGADDSVIQVAVARRIEGGG